MLLTGSVARLQHWLYQSSSILACRQPYLSVNKPYLSGKQPYLNVKQSYLSVTKCNYIANETRTPPVNHHGVRNSPAIPGHSRFICTWSMLMKYEYRRRGPWWPYSHHFLLAWKRVGDRLYPDQHGGRGQAASVSRTYERGQHIKRLAHSLQKYERAHMGRSGRGGDTLNGVGQEILQRCGGVG